MPKLTKEQASVWRRVCSILDDMGVLTKADPFQLERYCVMLLRWRACEEFIAKNGITYPLKASEPSQYVGRLPNSNEYVVGFAEYDAVKESHRLDKALKQIESNFGMTPSARSRISTAQHTPKVVDPLEDFLKASNG